MVRPAQTARSERTRAALLDAAAVRFLAQGVDDTSAEQIAADAGVSLRTFYRHFSSKHDLLFADYSGLQWFRAALEARPADEPLLESVQTAILAFPYDVEAVAKIAGLRHNELDPERIVRHTRQVESEFADAIVARLNRNRVTGERSDDGVAEPGVDERLRIMVTARCIATSVFGAMDMWMVGEDRSLSELARLCSAALDELRKGILDH